MEVQDIKEQLADGFQSLADTDTAFRAQTARQIGELVAHTEPEWPATYAVAGALLTDKTDGLWATFAKKIRGYDVVTDGGSLDPQADHQLMEALMEGLTARAITMEDWSTAEKLRDYRQRTEARNKRMDTNRDLLVINGVDKRELRANLPNKAKMVFQAIGCSALVSPLSRNRMVRRAAVATIGAGTKSSEIGEKMFRQKVDRLIDEQAVNY